jgi:hypothetical protein
MNLQGSITENQSALYKMYLKLEQRFTDNILIRELWSSMAQDVSQQLSSLKGLPVSFWAQQKKNPEGLPEAIHQAMRSQAIEKVEVLSLKLCFSHALESEEPTILKVYVPIIRNLRKNWTNASLDFYILVKAHLARIVRVTESFSGDPILVQRANLLLQGFEKEVQEPEITAIIPNRKSITPHAEQKKKPESKNKKPLKVSRPLAKHPKVPHSRTKPLAKKVELPRRRASR